MHLTHDFSFSHGWWGWLFDGAEALSSGAERSLAVKLRLFFFAGQALPRTFSPCLAACDAICVC